MLVSQLTARNAILMQQIEGSSIRFMFTSLAKPHIWCQAVTRHYSYSPVPHFRWRLLSCSSNIYIEIIHNRHVKATSPYFLCVGGFHYRAKPQQSYLVLYSRHDELILQFGGRNNVSDITNV